MMFKSKTARTVALAVLLLFTSDQHDRFISLTYPRTAVTGPPEPVLG